MRGVEGTRLREELLEVVEYEARLVGHDREGRIVGRWIIKDPATVRGTLGPGARVAPEFVPAQDPDGSRGAPQAPDGTPQAPRATAPAAGAATEPEGK